MRIAHLSDLHILALDGVSPLRFLNKRLTGYVNLKLKRKHIHRPLLVRAIANEIARQKVDHVVLTGDFTNLALDEEFVMVRELLELELAVSPDKMTMVPGNHDVYTRGAYRERRFQKHFQSSLVSDLPELSVETPSGRFPVVHLRGRLAIIGLTSAVPRLPFVAAGRLGEAQLRALRAILKHPEVKERTPIFVLHHPAHNPVSWLARKLRGLDDSTELLSSLGDVEKGILLHGHLHTRVHRIHTTTRGTVNSYGATSASLDHHGVHQMAGFNIYEFDEAGVFSRASAQVYDPRAKSFRTEEIPEG